MRSLDGMAKKKDDTGGYASWSDEIPSLEDTEGIDNYARRQVSEHSKCVL